MLSAAWAVRVVMRHQGGPWGDAVVVVGSGDDGGGWRRRGREEIGTGMATLMWTVPLEVVEPVISICGRGVEGWEAEEEEEEEGS